MKKYLVIIPARGGSKGIKNKNIIKVKGLPLIAYTINAAKELIKSGYKTEIIVSTDSNKIAAIAKKYKAAVPFLRPANISGDKSKSIDYVLHSVSYFKSKGINFNATIILQPTSPLRSGKDILNSIKIFEQNKNNSLISVYHEPIPDNIVYRKSGNYLTPLVKRHNAGLRRQDSRDIYVRNGAIYITSVNFLLRNKKIFSDRPLVYEMPKERSINIDSLEDLKKLRKII